MKAGQWAPEVWEVGGTPAEWPASCQADLDLPALEGQLAAQPRLTKSSCDCWLGAEGSTGSLPVGLSALLILSRSSLSCSCGPDEGRCPSSAAAWLAVSCSGTGKPFCTILRMYMNRQNSCRQGAAATQRG